MERAITRITLDVQRIDSGTQIKAKLGDSARRLVVSLTNRGRPYAPGEGVTAVYYSRKADGVPCFNDCQIDGSTVTYDFTGQTANVEGVATCEIRLYDAEMKLLTSPRFELLVDGTEYRDGDIPDSSPEYTALTEMIGQGTALINDFSEAVAQMNTIKSETETARDEAVTAAEEASEAAERVNSTASQVSAAVTQAQAARDGAVGAAEAAEAAAARAEAAGGLTITDDGQGNVTIISGGTSAVTDDGAGNITFM